MDIDRELYVLDSLKKDRDIVKNSDAIKGCFDSKKRDYVDFIKQDKRRMLIIPQDESLYQELVVNGMVEFEDFIKEQYYQKKIVVIYGNCHTTVIAEVMSGCKEFQKEYAIYPIKPIHLINSADYFEHPVFKCCDVFIHQSIQKQNRYGEEFASENLISLLRKDCLVISIPNVYHLPMCFFPQYYPENEFVVAKKGTIFFRDHIIDRLFCEGKSVKQIEAEYLHGQHFLSKELAELFDTFLKKIQDRERDWDVKITDFIKNNYQKEQLFFDPNHPTSVFLKYVASEVLSLLNINYDKDWLVKIKVKELDSYEMPIYPTVKENFGMTFSNCYYRQTGRKARRGSMNLKEYILQYISFEWQNPNVRKGLRMKSYIINRWILFSAFFRVLRELNTSKIKKRISLIFEQWRREK